MENDSLNRKESKFHAILHRFELVMAVSDNRCTSSLKRFLLSFNFFKMKNLKMHTLNLRKVYQI
jgi:hypothetical protein